MTASRQTVFDVLRKRVLESPDEIAFAEWTSAGLQHVSRQQFHDEVMNATSVFLGLGVQKGDRIGILLKTSLAFEVAQFGLLSMGGVVIGLDPRDSNEGLGRAMTKTHIVGLVVEDFDDLTRLEPSVRARLQFAIEAKEARVEKWRGVLRNGATLEPIPLMRGQLPPAPPEPHDLATIVLTSGSSGEPKGYGYRHDQLVRAALTCRTAFNDVGHESRLIAWLPLSALFQRMINLAAWIAGSTTYFVSDPADVARRAQEVHPTLFFGVPRFYQKLRGTILAHAAHAPRHQRWLIESALENCRIRGTAKREGRIDWKAELAARTVFRTVIGRLRRVLGDELRVAVTGSAPMPTELIDEFEGLGIPIIEAYAMTECITPIAMSSLSARRVGTVGRPLDDLEVRLAEDGEIEVRGSGLPEFSLDSSLPLTKDGYLRTGDIGVLDGGFLRIVDRKGSIFKLSTGHKVAPAPIEEALKRLPWVDQAQVLGRGRARPVAILWIDPSSAPPEREIRDHLSQAIRHFERRSHPEEYMFFHRLARLEEGEITLTQKLRRADNERRYAAYFDKKLRVEARRNAA